MNVANEALEATKLVVLPTNSHLTLESKEGFLEHCLSNGDAIYVDTHDPACIERYEVSVLAAQIHCTCIQPVLAPTPVVVLNRHKSLVVDNDEQVVLVDVRCVGWPEVQDWPVRCVVEGEVIYSSRERHTDTLGERKLGASQDDVLGIVCAIELLACVGAHRRLQPADRVCLLPPHCIVREQGVHLLPPHCIVKEQGVLYPASDDSSACRVTPKPNSSDARGQWRFSINLANKEGVLPKLHPASLTQHNQVAVVLPCDNAGGHH